MPKNFAAAKADGTRVPQAANNATKIAERAKRMEVAFWQDSGAGGDKHSNNRNPKRKDERAPKKQAVVTRKPDSNVAILVREAARIIAEKAASKGKGAARVPRVKSKLPVKVTRAQLVITAEGTKKPPPLLLPRRSRHLENANRMSSVAVPAEEARRITDAMKIFEWHPEEIDKHPEKRLKAAFSSYEQSRLVFLRKVHPNLRLPQLKQIVFREWQKAAEKPFGRKAA